MTFYAQRLEVQFTVRSKCTAKTLFCPLYNSGKDKGHLLYETRQARKYKLKPGWLMEVHSHEVVITSANEVIVSLTVGLFV